MGRGAQKGDNRFQNHQSEKQTLRLVLLKRVLRDVAKRKQIYPNEWQLAEHAAEEINLLIQSEYPEVARKKRGLVHPSTLIRKGTKYKMELAKHLLNSEKLTNINEMAAKLLEYQLEIAAVKDELVAQKNFAKKYLSRTDENNLTKSIPDNTINIKALDSAYKIILALVEASDSLFIFHNGELIDRARTANNVIADESLINTSGLLESSLYKGLVLNK